MATKKTKLHLQTLYLQQKYSQFLERCDAHPNTGNLQIQLLRINCLSKTNEDEKAFELFKKLFLKNRLNPFNRAIASRTLNRFLQKLSYDDWFRKFQYLARRNLFSEFLKERRYIKSPQLHNLFYAEFYYRQRRYSSVLKRLASVKSPKLLDHKKKLILKIEIRRRDYSNIFPVLEELEDEPSLYEELLFDAASILLIHRQLDLSLSLLSKYINFMEVQKAVNRPGSNYWKALWLSAWIHYRENREEKALRYFEKGLRSGSDSYKMASTYWYHRLKETDADDAASQIARFPFSYYYAKTAGPGPDDGIAGLKRFITLINE
ncbi:MAG: hypothetical protein GY950_15640, partial [bacterium]|nr:hypothetical protein [bacterium]